MADEKKGNNQSKGPSPLFGLERFGVFATGKAEAVLWRLFGMAFLLATFFVGAATFLAVLLMGEEGWPISAGLGGLTIALFLTFRWLWIQARDVIDDEVYEPVVTESPGKPRLLTPSPAQVSAESPAQIETTVVDSTDYTVLDNKETRV